METLRCSRNFTALKKSMFPLLLMVLWHLLAYSLLLAQSDNIPMYYFTRINTHRPLGKKIGTKKFSKFC